MHLALGGSKDLLEYAEVVLISPMVCWVRFEMDIRLNPSFTRIRRIDPIEHGRRGERRAYGRTIDLTVDGDRQPKDIGNNLAPDVTARPTTRQHDLIRLNSLLFEDEGSIPEREDRPFEHGSGQVATIMAEREAKECAARQWIHMRRTFASEVGEKRRPFAPTGISPTVMSRSIEASWES